MAQFCTKCGNEVKPNSKFCNKCGNAVKPIALSNNKGQTNNNDKEYSIAESSNGLITKLQNQKITVQIIVAIVGIVIVCGLFSIIKIIFKGNNNIASTTTFNYWYNDVGIEYWLEDRPGAERFLATPDGKGVQNIVAFSAYQATRYIKSGKIPPEGKSLPQEFYDRLNQ